MEKYNASCHCGAVKISFETEPITQGLQCNCSHCFRKGFILTFLPFEQITVLSGENNQTEYRFNKKTIGHLFCKTCGVEVYTRTQMDDKEMSAVNIRAIEDFDISTLTLNEFNGKEY
jgi:hypothetical protein